MRVDRLFTMDKATRLTQPDLIREHQALRDKKQEAAGDIVASGLKSVAKLIASPVIAPIAMALPRIDPKAAKGHRVQMDPWGRLGDYFKSAGVDGLQAAKSAGLFTTRAGTLGLRKLIGI